MLFIKAEKQDKKMTFRVAVCWPWVNGTAILLCNDYKSHMFVQVVKKHVCSNNCVIWMKCKIITSDIILNWAKILQKLMENYYLFHDLDLTKSATKQSENFNIWQLITSVITVFDNTINYEIGSNSGKTRLRTDDFSEVWREIFQKLLEIAQTLKNKMQKGHISA